MFHKLTKHNVLIVCFSDKPGCGSSNKRSDYDYYSVPKHICLNMFLRSNNSNKALSFCLIKATNMLVAFQSVRIDSLVSVS